MFDIVDFAIFAVGLSLIPLVPDLVTNIIRIVHPAALSPTSNSPRLTRMLAMLRLAAAKYMSGILVVLSLSCYPSTFYGYLVLMHSFYDVHPVVLVLMHVFVLYLELSATFYFLRSVFRSPGTTSEMMDIEAVDTTRFCKKCELPKPPRAHHCQHCNKCILRMDHHCPFTGNCVGSHNICYFLSFICYSWFGNLLTCIITWKPFSECFLDLLSFDGPNPSLVASDRCLAIGHLRWCFVIAFVVFSFAALMMVWMFALMYTGLTTVEFIHRQIEWVRTRKLPPNPHNAGLVANIRLIFGGRPLWKLLLPFQEFAPVAATRSSFFL